VADKPLGVRLYQDRWLHELARFISYGGRTHESVRQFMVGHREKHSEEKALWALQELTKTDEATGLTVLRPEARKACRVLLGPPPDSPEYADYWRKNQCDPPPEHQAPQKEEPQVAPQDAKPRKRSSRRKKEAS
jgi:hypothetical protein